MRILAPLLAAILLTAPPTLAQGDGGAVSAKGNTVCPVMPDEPADPAITAEWNGRTVAFCCLLCRKQFLADPDAFAANLPALPQAEPEASVGSAPAGSPTTTEADVAPEETERAAPDGRPASWKAWLGRLHPVAIHFPIVFLILAGAAELLVRPGESRWRARARFALALGAPSAVLAAWLGWIAATESGFPTLEHVLFRHRWLGVATAAVACLALLVAPRERTRERRRERIYRGLVVATMILVILAGHHGGTLIYGPEHLLPPR